jgi:hypothetical protein
MSDARASVAAYAPVVPAAIVDSIQGTSMSAARIGFNNHGAAASFTYTLDPDAGDVMLATVHGAGVGLFAISSARSAPVAAATVMMLL